MSIVQTGNLTPQSDLSSLTRLQVYNGLDACLTVEVWEELQLQASRVQGIYDFERALQGPYLEIMQRGFRVDQQRRQAAASRLRQRLVVLQTILDSMAWAVWDRGLNPRSPQQLADFFYRAMRLPEVWLNQKGERKLSTNREALEKLNDYLHAQPFVSCILAIRDIGKQLDVLEGEIDPDGRFRASYNIAGTETGRPSSSTNAFGTGGNAQNIAPGLRDIFVADPGWRLVQVDLEQVEARDVGFFCGCLFDDWSFLDNCESGDLHTNNAKLIWPEMPWSGVAKADRELANRLFYRDFSYRDMTKRGGHLSHYVGTAWTASRSLKVPLGIMEEFQARYIRGRTGHRSLPDIQPAFPCIPRWWQWTATELQQRRVLTTPFGRTRHFFGRPGDDATLREAVAFMPQSTTADRMNLGMWRTWWREREVQLLAQTYDSITFQVREDSRLDDTIGRVLEHIAVELVAPGGRKYVVPGEALVGWNWGKQSAGNPEGLGKWRPGGDGRQRRWGLDGLVGAGR